MDIVTLTIRDDRGQSVPLYRPPPPVVPPSDSDEIPPADFKRIRAWITQRDRATHVLWVFAVVGGFACMMALLAISVFGGLPITWFGMFWWTMTIVPYVIALLAWKRTIPSRSRRVLRAALLEHGRCASCGYALAGCPAEADGCRICPECAGAWRITA